MASSRREIYLATGNLHKLAEFQQMAERAALATTFFPANPMPAVVEDTGTFEGNARKKASALKATLSPGAWVLADDSGLCIDALGGGPGVESAYYAGANGNPAANLAKLVEVMKSVPATRRQAHFICTLVLLSGELGEETIWTGRCDGTLRLSPAGVAGFGYDPLFVPDGCTETFAELADGRKNEVSHRARAFAQLSAWLARR